MDGRQFAQACTVEMRRVAANLFFHLTSPSTCLSFGFNHQINGNFHWKNDVIPNCVLLNHNWQPSNCTCKSYPPSVPSHNQTLLHPPMLTPPFFSPTSNLCISTTCTQPKKKEQNPYAHIRSLNPPSAIVKLRVRGNTLVLFVIPSYSNFITEAEHVVEECKLRVVYGTNYQPGIVSLALKELFHQASLDSTAFITFSMSTLEVYMGNLRTCWLINHPIKRMKSRW